MSSSSFPRPRPWAQALTGLALAFSLQLSAHAHRPSSASEASVLPIAVSVTAPALLLSGVGALSVVAVEHTAQGVVWVLERATDGARASVRVTGQIGDGLSQVVGQPVAMSLMQTGTLLTASGRVIAFVPNERGARLMYHEEVLP